MPRRHPTDASSWREKRKHQGLSNTDTKKRAKANRERFRRQKTGAFRKANNIFIDGLDTGRDRYVYVLIMDKTQSGVRYSTYNSHPELKWVPAAEEVVSVGNLTFREMISD